MTLIKFQVGQFFLQFLFILKKSSEKGSEHLIKNRCVSAECMDAAAWLMGNMDDRYDPCDDFYNRACANYANQ